MDNNLFFSNNSFEHFEDNEIDNNSLFFNQKEDNLLQSYNNDEEENNYSHINNNINNNNELMFTDSYPNINLNLKLENSFQIKNDLFQENNSLKDISSIENASSNLRNNNDSNENSSSLNNISNNSSSTKEKSQLKNINNMNNDDNEINDNINKKEEVNLNNKEINKEILNKKRKPRVHLEDLGLDPEKIKDKKFEKIGDKVFLSKNKILTEEDKKEVRAIRNRISAQKSRDRKKAEFSLFQKQIKYLNEQLNQKILIIENIEKACCPKCKTKLEEITKKISSEKNENNININTDLNEELILEEKENDFVISNKKNSLIGKIPGLLIGIVCLIGITLCIFQNPFNYNNKNIPLRNLKNININNNSSFILNDINNINKIEKENESFIIYEEPNSPRQNDYIKIKNEIEEGNEFLQMCHDKFIFDIFSNNKKKKDLEEKQKTGFLVKKTYNKLDPNSFCYETNSISNGNYIINNNNFTNTLPIKRDNMILNEYISKRIISLFIKDYDALKKYSNGKLLTLKEQIEHGIKNSEDGCIYLQLIIPKNDMDINYDKKNDTCPNEDMRYFEIRCKVLSYFNYYDREI